MRLIEKNKSYILDITGMTHEGQGVGRVDHFTVFVDGALSGETVEATIIKVTKSYAVGKLMKLVKPSEGRAEPFCGVYNRCGGCSLQHMDYAAQLTFKTDLVRESLRRIGKLENVTVHEIIGMEKPFKYRNKAQYPVAPASIAPGKGDWANDTPEKGARVDEASKKGIRKKGTQAMGASANAASGKSTQANGALANAALGKGTQTTGALADRIPAIGFYARRSHDVVESKACAIQDDISVKVRSIVKDYILDNGISVYDEDTGRGLVRHVMTRVGFKTGEVMVVLVINGKALPAKEDLIERLIRSINGLKSIVLNVNTKNTNVILGNQSITLYGSGFITDYIGEFRFYISSLSFFQVNPVQTEVLYRKALEYAGLTGKETVFDLYCGIGTISLLLSKRAKKVYGVEVVEEAVADARKNAELNKVRNVEFIAGKAEKVIPDMYSRGIHADVVVVDPPRKGCDEALLKTLVEMQPQRIVYVSCNPATLARDLKYLDENGYRTAEVQPVDMFPWTGHVECVVLMSRVEK